MKIDFLKLVNFRNYERLEIKFHPTLNVIYGKNGSGKTNLVEAIYVLGLTRSFRLTNDKNLILDGASLSKVEGNIIRKYPENYRIFLSKEGKKVKINNNKVSKISDYISKITIVLFHPDDLRFIKDTPSTRRKNLNISISMLDLEYLRFLNYYKIILKQRNSYLKQMQMNGNRSTTYLDILTEKLVEIGLIIYQRRKDFVDKISKYIEIYYAKIVGIDGLKLEYISDYNNLDKEEILKIYRKNLQKDIAFGKTNMGIHTDDLQFLLNNKDLKDFGSEGQQKNAIIAYKFSELEIFKDKTGIYPIFILDDLFSELDQEKINNILFLLNDNVQTFITTTDLERFESLNQRSYKQINVEMGKIVEESEHERGK